MSVEIFDLFQHGAESALVPRLSASAALTLPAVSAALTLPAASTLPTGVLSVAQAVQVHPKVTIAAVTALLSAHNAGATLNEAAAVAHSAALKLGATPAGAVAAVQQAKATITDIVAAAKKDDGKTLLTSFKKLGIGGSAKTEISAALKQLDVGGQAKTAISATLKQLDIGGQVKLALNGSGLPPELLTVASLFVKGGGSVKSVLNNAALAAQNLVEQLSGPAGKLAGSASFALMNALHIKPDAVSAIAGSAGSAVGNAFAGPAGGAVADFITSTVAGGIEKLVKTSPSEKEAQRGGNDLKRVAVFAKAQGLKPLTSHFFTTDLDKWYDLFSQGKIRIARGAVGGDSTHWAVKNGALVQLTKSELAKWPHVLDPKRLAFDSERLSARFIDAITPIEAQRVDKAQKAQAQLKKIKLVQAGLKRAADKVLEQKKEDIHINVMLNALLKQRGL